MTDQPKRRGRPPKVRVPMTPDEAHVEALTAFDREPAVFHAMSMDQAMRQVMAERPAWADDPWSETRGYPLALPYYRLKAGALQQAWQHHNGKQWRPLPVVPADAPDWEDS